jgi:branched-chain amino acid transport system ATP-binding protein
MEGQAVLAAVGVRKQFGALAALDGVDFAIGPGEAVGIVGPNGAGKTTLLNVLAGAVRPSGGSVVYRGADVTASGVSRRSRLGVARAHQIPKPFGGMTVFENCFVGATSGGGLGRRDAYARCLDVLETCGLAALANRRADTLGLLGRKRLELARALATGPTVLLLDEIAAGLTEAEAEELVAMIRQLHASGIAIVWIEHIVHVLVQVIERLVCMDYGRMIADGEPATVMSDARVIDAYLGGATA